MTQGEALNVKHSEMASLIIYLHSVHATATNFEKNNKE